MIDLSFLSFLGETNDAIFAKESQRPTLAIISQGRLSLGIYGAFLSEPL